MQIDLLSSRQGEVGLVANGAFTSDISIIIFDVAERSLTLEYGEAMDSMKLNVPVGEDFVSHLVAQDSVHVCAIEKGRMVYAKQVPLIKVSMDEDDVVSSGGGMARGVMGVQAWLKKVITGQPAHRDDLGNITTAGGIMHREGLSPATLQAAPHLAKQLVAEQALAQKNQLQNQPRFAPPSLGPGSQVPGMGLGNLMPRTPRSGDDE